MPHPGSGKGIPRCELYLLTDNSEELFSIAITAGATEVSAIGIRDWGHVVGYVSDRDGHIIAFASET